MRPLDRYARRGLWALVAWAVLLFYATFTHQPDYRTRFGDWSRYVTTTSFLVGHLVGSILGAAIGILGFVCMSVLLIERGAPRLGLSALITAVVGAVFTNAIFGVAAFAQPAIGRAYLAGHGDAAALYNDVNGGPLLGMAVIGVLSLSTALILYGIAVIRTGLASKWAGWALAVGGPTFAILGVALADIVQTVGAILLAIGAAGIAWAARRMPTVVEPS
jgi:hypothetical protein